MAIGSKVVLTYMANQVATPIELIYAMLWIFTS